MRQHKQLNLKMLFEQRKFCLLVKSKTRLTLGTVPVLSLLACLNFVTVDKHLCLRWQGMVNFAVFLAAASYHF